MTKLDMIFDLDGTIADGQQYVELYLKKKPKRYDLFYDTVDLHGTHEATINVLKALHKCGHHIIFATARGEECRKKTMVWIDKHIPELNGSYLLFMKPEGDYRKDYIVKQEMLEEMWAQGYNPVLAFDDKPEVVDMYRKAGLTCFHVRDYV